MHENNSGVATSIQPYEMSFPSSSSILGSTIPAPVAIPSRVNIVTYYEKLQTAREAMEQSDYHTSYATACDLLSESELPVALLVACHVIAGTSVLGQRAIDHFREAERNAASCMGSEVFNGFKDLCRILMDGAFKDGAEEDHEDTVKAEIQEREVNKVTFTEKSKAKVEVQEIEDNKDAKESKNKA